MKSDIGYIYIRTHCSYDIHNVCRLGKTKDIQKTDNEYAENELKRGQFKKVFKVANIDYTLDLLRNNFEKRVSTNTEAIDFFDKKIIKKIESFFDTNKIVCEKLSKNKINNLLKK